MRVMIIEDEPLMADELEMEVLKADPEIVVEGKFASVQATLRHLSENEMPDVFFSDIQLSDGLSFEIFSHFEIPVPVIFCTAFHEYALDAFKANGIDYLLKPFEDKAITDTITKYKQLIGNKSPSSSLSELLTQFKRRETTHTKSLLIHQGQKIFSVKYSAIRILHLKDGIVHLITDEAKKYIVNSSLDRIEQSLDGHFYRANRQVIIHKEAIAYASSYFSRKLLITPNFKIDFDIVVSKASAGSFLKWLES